MAKRKRRCLSEKNFLLGLAKAMKSLRIVRELRQEDVANRAGVSKVMIFKLENLDRYGHAPTISTLFYMAMALDVTLTELVAFAEEYGLEMERE